MLIDGLILKNEVDLLVEKKRQEVHRIPHGGNLFVDDISESFLTFLKNEKKNFKLDYEKFKVILFNCESDVGGFYEKDTFILKYHLSYNATLSFCINLFEEDCFARVYNNNEECWFGYSDDLLLRLKNNEKEEISNCIICFHEFVLKSKLNKLRLNCLLDKENYSQTEVDRIIKVLKY